MGLEIFYGVVEAFHLEIILSIIIHLTLRDKVNPDNKALNLFAVFLLAVMSLGLLVLYIFMAYKVKKLTEAYFKYVVLEVKDMKDEPWRFLLSGKNVKGNMFQRHFNLINLLKDLVFCIFLYFSYNSPLLVVLVIFFIHLPCGILTMIRPPLLVEWENLLLKINAVAYILLDLGFLINICTAMKPETRYYYIGFTMCVLVGLLILTNIGMNTFYGIKQAWQKFKKWRERRNRNKIAASKNTSELKVNIDKKEPVSESFDQLKDKNTSIVKQTESTTPLQKIGGQEQPTNTPKKKTKTPVAKKKLSKKASISMFDAQNRRSSKMPKKIV